MKARKALAEHKTTFDELIGLTKSYRYSASYFQFINFVAKIKNYSAYNTALIYAQNPNVTYVASKTDWKKRHDRVVKPEARPLIILAPFHPVLFVFDVNDTEGAQLPERVFSPFWANGTVPDNAMDTIYKFCRKQNIVMREVKRGTNSAGSIRTEYVKGKFKSYVIEVNNSYSPEVKFATIIHELAHLLCGHLGTHCDQDFWREREGLSLAQREFEAESVSFIVCKRYGIHSNSDEYLSGYIQETSVIPNISIDTVLHVSGSIENAIKGKSPSIDKKKSIGNVEELQQLSLF